MNKEFKYKSEPFTSIAKAVIPTDYDKYLATASLKSLQNIFGNNINVEENPDLLYFAANGAVGNLSNRNTDCITNSDLIKIAPASINKFLTVEHRRDAGSVGAISHYGFSEYGSNRILTEEEYLNTNEPINWVVGGYLWQLLSPALTKLVVESSDEQSNKFGAVSLSWEILFSDYYLMVGSPNTNDANIIKDENQIKELSKYLKSNGGTGIIRETKEPVFRLIVGEMLPVGYSLVSSPAAHVKGLTVLDDSEKELSKSSEHNNEIIELNSLKDEKNEENDKKILESSENILIENKNSVNKDVEDKNNTNLYNKTKTNTMAKLKFQDINDEVLKTATANDVYEVAQELDKGCKEYAQQLDTKAAELQAAKDEVNKVKELHNNLASELDKVKAELKELNETRAKEKAQNDFNIRMSELNDAYNILPEQSKSIAKQIRNLNDEDFASWLEDHKSFLVAKDVEDKSKESKDKEDEKEGEDDKMDDECKAKKSCKASLLDEIKNLKPETEPILNKTSGSKSLNDIFAEAFEGVGEE